MSHSEIRICESHDFYQVPLLFTFAFPYKEFWCPYCGRKYEFFGAGLSIPVTEQLKVRKTKYAKLSKQYLMAQGSLHAAAIIYKGKRYTKRTLPEKLVNKFETIRKSWLYWQKVD